MADRFVCKQCGLKVGLIPAPKELSGASWKHFTSRKVDPPHQPHPVRHKEKADG